MAQGNPRIVPPDAPMALTRTLIRELTGGAAVIVTRVFSIRFTADAEGWTIQGTQISSKVSAPEALSALARIEENRVETGFFPMRIDRQGRLVSVIGPESEQSGDALNEAIRYAAGNSVALAGSVEDAKTLRQFLAIIGRVGPRNRTSVPPLLFVPPDQPLESTVPVVMADGAEGEIRTRFSGITDPETGLMTSAERRVETELAGSLKLTREEWSLAPLTTPEER